MSVYSIDAFAGAGGWSQAAKRLGIIDFGIEKMPEARATRANNNHITVSDDVWTFDHSVLPGAAGLIASPPCPSFSAAGKGDGRRKMNEILRAIDIEMWRYRGNVAELAKAWGESVALVLIPLTYAIEQHPEWIAWEQVPPVLPIWERCAEVLRSEGYSVWTGNLHAEQYGDPQTRKRAVLIASRVREVGPPPPTHSKYHSRNPSKLDPGVEKWVSMNDVLDLSDLGHVVSNYGTGGDARRRGVRLLTQPSATVTEKIGRNKIVFSPSGVTGPVNRSLDCPAATITGAGNAVVFRASNTAHACIRTLDHPAPTILFAEASNDVRWYPEGSTQSGKAETAEARSSESRRVTVAEAGVLQSFPADYRWQGNQSKQYLQVGNAIPVCMAEAVLREAAGL